MANTNRPKPSLDECRARIDRARTHIKSLEGKLSAIGSPTLRWIENHSVGHLVIPDVDIPPIVRILIGETLYNLRAALDYLVSQLFYLATGKFDGRTKFLIEDSETGWDQHLTGKHPWLHRIPPNHQATLKGLQPFNGCTWTKSLRIRSNIDKHRHFLAAKGSLIIRAPADYRPGSQTTPSAIAAAMEMQRNIARAVAFDDGAPVIESLAEIKKHTRDVIRAFDSNFK